MHGTLDESGSFRRAQDHLSRWSVTTYDRRGWGQSAPLGPAPLAQHAADLTDVLDGLGPSIVAGHSYGATIALTVAAARPDLVTAVVAYEPPLPWLPWWPERAPWEQIVLDEGHAPADAAEALLRSVLGAEAWLRLPERVRERRRAEGPVLVEEMRSLRAGPPSFDPEAVECPVVTAAGAESLPHHCLTARRLADLLPKGRYREIAGAGHPGHVTHPGRFADLVSAVAEAVPVEMR